MVITMLAATTLALQPSSSDAPPQFNDALLAEVLSHPDLTPITENSERYKFQLIVTAFSDHPNADPEIASTVSHRSDAEYFYPASTIKLCAAVGALLAVQEMNGWGIPVTVDSPLTYHPLFDDQEIESRDDSNADSGAITLRHEIRKLFLVSDNRAFNRLYEFVGQERLNNMMWEHGFESVRITHRLSTPRSLEDNARSPRIDIALGDGRTHTIPERTSPLRLTNRGVEGLRVGSAVKSSGVVTPGPKDFSRSNRISLEDLHALLLTVAYEPPNQEWNGRGLTPEHLKLLREAMSQLPSESDNPTYDETKYSDDYVKFMLPGVREALPDGDPVIINKIGLAYGFTTDTAVVLDRKTGRWFAITGTMYTNENGILNDNVYEYETVAFPFWRALGRELSRRLLAP